MRPILTIFLLLLVAPSVLAQGSSFNSSRNRADSMEVSIQIPYQGSETVGGLEGSGISFSSQTGIGGSFTYNYTNHFSVSGDLAWTRPRYDARFVVEDPEPGESEVVEISHKADMFNGQVRATWNFLEGPVTPFVEGSLGFTYTDSNVTDGPPTTGCWWDPWWGYVCRNYWSTHDDWNWSYGAGVGIRWEINRDYAVRGLYSKRYIDLSNSSDPSLDIYQFDLVFRF